MSISSSIGNIQLTEITDNVDELSELILETIQVEKQFGYELEWPWFVHNIVLFAKPPFPALAYNSINNETLPEFYQLAQAILDSDEDLDNCADRILVNEVIALTDHLQGINNVLFYDVLANAEHISREQFCNWFIDRFMSEETYQELAEGVYPELAEYHPELPIKEAGKIRKQQLKRIREIAKILDPALFGENSSCVAYLLTDRSSENVEGAPYLIIGNHLLLVLINRAVN